MLILIVIYLSPSCVRFRVVARGMAAFLSIQVPTEDQIRLKPGAELYLTPKAQQVSENSFIVKG